MVLEINNTGSGFIGTPDDGWRVSQNGSPAIVGSSSGRLGGLNFRAACDNTSIFTIDDYLTVKHYYDSGDRWLSTFDGYVRGLDLTPGFNFGSFSMVSKLSALDVERQTSANTSGVYENSALLPATAYTILGTPYVTPENPIIYDMASADDNFTFVLAQGAHNGEVVFVLGIDGQVFTVWPVYSDAADLAGPGSRIIASTVGSVWIGQTTAKRVQKFAMATGAPTLSFGAAGSADGQFQSIDGIALNTAWNSIFVSDAVLGRIQRFSLTGTYSNKWGTPGTGSGNTVFNNVNRLAVTSTGDHVFASDYNGRVREYDSFGNLQSTPFGGYDFTTNTVTRELAANAEIKVCFDPRDNAYAMQSGSIFKYVNSTTGNWETSTPVAMSWVTGSAGCAMSITPSGVLNVGTPARIVEQYSASPDSLKAYILYIVALAKPNFKVRLLIMNEPSTTPEYPTWRGNVWGQLCDLMAMTGNSMTAYDDALYFSSTVGDTVRLPEDVSITPISINSRASGRAVQIVSHNTVRVDADDKLLYDAMADNNRTFSVDLNEFTYVTLSQNTYAEYIFPMVAVSAWPPAPGEYVVTDKNNLTVTPTMWDNAGGSVVAKEGANPGEIQMTLTGPTVAIAGYEAPFSISSVSDQAALKIAGVGVRANPEVLTIGTGVSEDVTNNDVAQTINSFCVTNPSDAYTAGSWAAYNSGTPTQRVTISMRLHNAPTYLQTQTSIRGISTMVGDITQIMDAQYIVEDLDYSQNEFTLSCYRYTQTGLPVGSDLDRVVFEEIWAGRKAGEFDSYWAGFTAQDITVAPLRNPYGV